MELLFCDVCNESVPQKDLDENRAKRRRGRVVCATCEGAMSHADISEAISDVAPGVVGNSPKKDASHTAASPRSVREAATPRSSGGRGSAAAALGLAAVALTAAVGGAAYLNGRLDTEIGERDAAVSKMRVALELSTNRVEGVLQADLASIAGDLVRVQEDLNAMRESTVTDGREERTRTEALRADLSGLTERLATVEAFSDEIDRVDLEVQKVGRFSADLHEQQLRLAQRIEGLREDVGNVRELASVDLGALLGSQAEENTGEVMERPAWLDFVGDLKSQSASVRWQAVQSIGQSGDDAAAEYLAPMLKDPDIFVRMAAARNLGDLAAPIGIPALIDALEDPEESVRESAAVSLRAFTGKDHRFGPGDKESERSKAVKRWRDWWASAQGELLGRDE